jgi:hypothetical protein
MTSRMFISFLFKYHQPPAVEPLAHSCKQYRP